MDGGRDTGVLGGGRGAAGAREEDEETIDLSAEDSDSSDGEEGVHRFGGVEQAAINDQLRESFRPGTTGRRAQKWLAGEADADMPDLEVGERPEKDSLGMFPVFAGTVLQGFVIRSSEACLYPGHRGQWEKEYESPYLGFYALSTAEMQQNIGMVARRSRESNMGEVADRDLSRHEERALAGRRRLLRGGDDVDSEEEAEDTSDPSGSM